MGDSTIKKLGIHIEVNNSQAVGNIRAVTSELKKLSQAEFENRRNKASDYGKAYKTAYLSVNELKQKIQQTSSAIDSHKTKMLQYSDETSEGFRKSAIQVSFLTSKLKVLEYALGNRTKRETILPKDLKTNLDDYEKRVKDVKGEWHGANEEAWKGWSGKVQQFNQADIKRKIDNTVRGLDLPEAKIKFKASNTPTFLQSNKWKGQSSTPKIKETSKDAEEGTSKIEKFTNAMSTLNKVSSKLDKGLGKVASIIGTIGKKILSALNPFKLFRNEQNKTAHSSGILGKAFSRLARMFRIMVTRMLIRGFISNIREGFQNIAQYSDEVNQKFSAIIGSAKTLYNAFASALTPIIEAVAPAVIRVLDFMISVMNKVAEFMSALTGKSYFIKATKYQYDYAKSLDKSTNSTNKNSKATSKNTKAKKKNKHETIGIDKLAKKKKKNKNATIDIDKLNVIAPDKYKNANNGNGNGNNGANVNDMFDTKPVSKKMQDLAKKVKQIAKKLFDPIQEAWNKKGSKVLTSMKKMLESIWKTVKDIGRDFLTMWQQPATEKIFEDILDTVSLIFDIVKAISDQFRKAWNKDKIGLHIFENLRDVVGIIVKGIKDCAKYTKKWAQHLNFSPLLESIERYTKSLKKLMKGLVDIASDFYKIVVLGISKWVIEKGLPRLIQVFTDFNNKVDWQSLRKSLKVLWDGIEKLAESIGDGLINVLGDLMDALADLLNSKWFQNLIKAIGNLMKSIKPKHIELFVKAWLGVKAIKFVGGLFGKIATKVGGVIKVIKWFKYTNVGAKIIGAFKTGKLKNFFVNLANQLSGIGTTAGSGKTVSNIAKNLGNKVGLSGTIKGIFSKLKGGIKKHFPTVVSVLSGAFSTLKGKLAELGGRIGQFFSSGFGNAVKSTLPETLGGAVGIIAGSKAIADLIALPYKQALDEAKKLDKEVEEHAKKVAMPEAYRKRLEKMTEVNKKIHEEFNAHKEVNGEILNNYENAKTYKEELDKIVGKNGKIKEGYELQAQVLVDQINEALGINLEIVDGQIKGYKNITKQLEKQIELVTIKNLAEKNAEKYYKAKSGIGGKYKELQSNKKAYNDSEAVQKYLSYNDLYKDAKAGMKLAKSRGDDEAYEQYKTQRDTYKKWRDEYAKDYKALKDAKNNSSKVYRDYYRTILRQNALYQAKNKKQREQAIANLEKPLTDAEIKNLNRLEKISKATGVSLEQTIEKYYKNGKIQYDKLPKKAKAVVKDIKKEAETKKANIKIKAENKSLNEFVKQIKKAIPKDLFGTVLGGAVKNKFVDPTKAINVAKAYKNAKKVGININTKLASGIALKTIDPDTALNYINALSTAKKKGKDISKYVGDGIFKNKASVQKATKVLTTEIDKLPDEKDTKVKIKGKDKYKSDSKDAGDSAKKNVPKELTTTIKLKLSAKNVGKSISKKIKKELGNYKFDHFTIGTGGTRYAVYVDKKGNKKTKKVPKGYASGGYPKLGSEFIAGEKGAEFVGNINGKTGVASNQEITGIRDSIESSSSTQNQILMEQNKLLVRLLEKNTDIVLDGQKITKRVNKINARSGYKMATT